MKTIYCKIYSEVTGKSQIGRMFEQADSWGFDDLVKWVQKNCRPAKIIIDNDKEVIAKFEGEYERMERYSFDEKYLKGEKK